LDLTGAQYGWKDILYKWDTFADCRFEQDIEYNTVIEQVCKGETFANKFPPNSMNGAQHILRHRVMSRTMMWLQVSLDENAEGWDPDGAIAISSVICARTETAFAARKKELLEQALKIPQACVNELGEIGRMYLSDSMEAQVVLSEDEAAWYSRVWLEGNDPRLVHLSYKDLEALWRQRMSERA
jgi:hypothetical protein